MLSLNIAYSQTIDLNALQKAPTKEECGCLSLDAYKKTSKTLKEGVVTVYKDVIIFSFGSSVKSFYLMEGSFYTDDKNKIYKLYYNDGAYGFLVGKTTYYFSN